MRSAPICFDISSSLDFGDPVMPIRANFNEVSSRNSFRISVAAGLAKTIAGLNSFTAAIFRN